MGNPAVKFSHNWNNKLDCSIFTTIRSWNPDKGLYYDQNIEKTFDIILNNKTHCKARLIGVDVLRLEDIPYPIHQIDTGFSSLTDAYTVFRKFKVDKRDLVILLLFQRIK